MSAEDRVVMVMMLRVMDIVIRVMGSGANVVTVAVATAEIVNDVDVVDVVSVMRGENSGADSPGSCRRRGVGG